MSETASQQSLTPTEYLAMERSSAAKHEFLRGDTFVMADASREHNLIVSNLVRSLGNALADRPCEVYASDMRVKVSTSGLYAYPDLVMTCEAPRFEDQHRDTLLYPNVLFEVLSDSTESYDGDRKLEPYRTLPSVAAYMLVSQREALVERFARQPDGSWLMREHRTDNQLQLHSIAVEIEVREIYASIFPEPQAREGG